MDKWNKLLNSLKEFLDDDSALSELQLIQSLASDGSKLDFKKHADEAEGINEKDLNADFEKSTEVEIGNKNKCVEVPIRIIENELNRFVEKLPNTAHKWMRIFSEAIKKYFQGDEVLVPEDIDDYDYDEKKDAGIIYVANMVIQWAMQKKEEAKTSLTTPSEEKNSFDFMNSVISQLPADMEDWKQYLKSDDFKNVWCSLNSVYENLDELIGEYTDRLKDVALQNIIEKLETKRAVIIPSQSIMDEVVYALQKRPNYGIAILNDTIRLLA